MQLKSEIEGETSRTRNALAPYQVRGFSVQRYFWLEEVRSKCGSDTVGLRFS